MRTRAVCQGKEAASASPSVGLGLQGSVGQGSTWNSLSTALICSGWNCPRARDPKMIQLQSCGGRTSWPQAQVLQSKSWSTWEKGKEWGNGMPWVTQLLSHSRKPSGSGILKTDISFWKLGFLYAEVVYPEHFGKLFKWAGLCWIPLADCHTKKSNNYTQNRIDFFSKWLSAVFFLLSHFRKTKDKS